MLRICLVITINKIGQSWRERRIASEGGKLIFKDWDAFEPCHKFMSAKYLSTNPMFWQPGPLVVVVGEDLFRKCLLRLKRIKVNVGPRPGAVRALLGFVTKNVVDCEEASLGAAARHRHWVVDNQGGDRCDKYKD